MENGASCRISHMYSRGCILRSKDQDDGSESQGKNDRSDRLWKTHGMNQVGLSRW